LYSPQQMYAPQAPQQVPQQQQQQQREMKQREQPNIEKMAVDMHKAMKGWGTNDELLISVLGSNSYYNLQAARAVYEREHKRDLAKEIASETSFNYSKVASSLVKERSVYDAELLHDAIKGVGTDDGQLIEVVCTRTAGELKQMLKTFQVLYKKEPLKEVKDDVSGDYGKLLMTVLQSDRPMPPLSQMAQDVVALYKAGEGRLGTDEDVFIKILGGNNRAYVEQLAILYKNKYGSDLLQVIDSETSFNFKKALLALTTPLHEWYAHKLLWAMDRPGTADKSLIRIFVTQKDRHLKQVTRTFDAKNKKPLSVWLTEETSGDYKRLLLAILNYSVNSA